MTDKIETAVVDIPKEKSTKSKAQICHVISYIPSNGVLTFKWGHIIVQTTVEKNLNISDSVRVVVDGDIKDGKIEIK